MSFAGGPGEEPDLEGADGARAGPVPGGAQ